MEIILPVIVFVELTYILTKPTSKKEYTPPKKFGEGLLQDSNSYDWWKPGDGGI